MPSAAPIWHNARQRFGRTRRRRVNVSFAPDWQRGDFSTSSLSNQLSQDSNPSWACRIDEAQRQHLKAEFHNWMCSVNEMNCCITRTNELMLQHLLLPCLEMPDAHLSDFEFPRHCSQRECETWAWLCRDLLWDLEGIVRQHFNNV